MSSNQTKKNNDQKNYNFIYSPINIPNKMGLIKDIHDNNKSKEQLTKYYCQNISSKNKTHFKNVISQSDKNKQKISASPNNQFLFKSKIQKDNNNNNTNQSKNFNETKNSEMNNKSPISLTGRITNLHNIKLNREKNEEDEKICKGSNNNLVNKDNKLTKSSNVIGHNSKSVNSNNKNRNLKYGNNIIIKTGNIIEDLNNLRKENIYKNDKKINCNYNNNHGIINNMNNYTSKNKKKNEISNNSNLNLGMLSFSTSNLSVNNIIPVNNHNLNNNNNINDSTNDLKINNINIIKNSNVTEEQNKNNLNLCLDYISNINNKKNKISQNKDENENENKNKKNIQTKSAEQTTRNPKYFKNESIYNTNYIINFIDSNEIKKGKLLTKDKIENNQIYVINQKDMKKNNFNNNAYKELTDITKKNVNAILSKNNTEKQNSLNEEKKNSNNNSTYNGNIFIKKYFECNDGQKYKNPEELHFTMVKITQNINKLKGKF